MSNGHVASFYERWERMETARQALRDDLQALFAEAKGDGLNPKALRQAFALTAEPEDRRQKRAAVDSDVAVYLDALAQGRAGARASASPVPTPQAIDNLSFAARLRVRGQNADPSAPHPEITGESFTTSRPDKSWKNMVLVRTHG